MNFASIQHVHVLGGDKGGKPFPLFLNILPSTPT